MSEDTNEELNENNGGKIYLSPTEIISFAFGIIIEKAWISIGLVKDTDGEFHKSKEDAEFLINMLTKMSDEIEGKFEETEIREIKNQISNLQLNFVNQFR